VTSEPPPDPSQSNAPEPQGNSLAAFARRARTFAKAVRIVAEQRRPAAEQAVREAAERTQRATKPAMERLMAQAQSAAAAAKPHLEDAAQQAATYAREHESQFKAAGVKVAHVAAQRIVPPGLRPAVDALEAEFLPKPDDDDGTPPTRSA
jgi:hypothetical protein